jgi:hypothetical protein
MLADKRAQRHAGHQRDGQAAKHNRNGRGRFLFGYQAGCNCRTNREEHAVSQAGQQAGKDQRL